MREFRPPIRPSLFRTALAILLPLVVLVPMAALFRLVTAQTPATYTIADGALVVDSGDLFAGKRTVRLSAVSEARAVSLHGGRRTAGTALPGFCAGRFSYPDLGAVWQVTTCSSRGVLLRGTGEGPPVVVSPPDPETFLAQIKDGTPTTITLPSPDKTPLRLLLYIVGPLGLVTALVFPALMLLGPRSMRYLVGDGMFEVQTLFGKKRWPTRGARARTHTPEKLRRTAGTAAPGYYTGIYRESGESTRVYATTLDRVVLFEGPARVIVSPEDRVELLRALEEEGAIIHRAIA